MAELKSLIVNGVTRLNNTGYAKNLYADKFITNGGTSSQYVRGDGTLAALSDLYNVHNHDSRYLLKNTSSAPNGDIGYGQYTFRKDVSSAANSTYNWEADAPVTLQHSTQFRVMKSSNTWALTFGVKDNMGWIDCVANNIGYGDIYLNPAGEHVIIGNYGGMGKTMNRNNRNEKFIVFGTSYLKGSTYINDNNFYLLQLNGGNQGGTGIQLTHDDTSPGLGILLYKKNDWGMAMLHYTANKAIGILDDGTPYFGWGTNKYTLWHAGNDGSGSGLDADLLDGLDSTAFYIKNVDRYGLENLICDINQGGKTTRVNNNKLTTTGEVADTYFYIKTVENIKAGQIYTFGWYVEGWPSTSSTWTFYANNNGNNLKVTIKGNGWAWGTGVMLQSGVADSSVILIDDGANPGIASTFSNFILVKGNIFPYYIPSISPTLAISSSNSNKINVTVNGRTSSDFIVPYATNSDTVDSYHETSFFRFRGSISANYVDCSVYDVDNTSGYQNPYNGVYSVQRSGYSAALIAITGSGSASGLDIYYSYYRGSDFKIRRRIDSKRFSGNWETILTDANYSSYVYSKSAADDRYVNVTGDTMTGDLKMDGTKNLSHSVWDHGVIAGADGHDKVVMSYLASNTNGAVIGAHNSNLSAWAVLNVSGTQLIFRNNETERMRLDASGNLGIGTSTPAYKLDITGTTRVSGNLLLGNASNAFIYRDYGGGSGLESGFYFHSTGRESVVFANQYAHTGWIFANGIKPSDRKAWNNLGVTPALQIHHNAIYVNRAVRDADTADYNLYVSGTSYHTGVIYGAGQPAFQTDAGAGNWNYIRLHNSSNFWDIATKSNNRNGSLEFRPGGADKGLRLQTSGMAEIATTGIDSSNYTSAAGWIREYNYGGSQTANWLYAPRLGWHWSGRVAAQIGLGTNGWLYEAPLTGVNFYRILCETTSVTWGINIGGNAATSTTATNLATSSASFTTGNPGWYKLAYYNSTDPRGSVSIALYTTGGNWVPFYSEIICQNGWSVPEFIQIGRIDYITKFRFTTDDSSSYIEGYFPNANVAINLCKMVGRHRPKDTTPGWILFTTATAGSGTTMGDKQKTVNSDGLFTTNTIEGSGFVKTDSSNDYVLLGGGGHKLVSDFSLEGHSHNYLPLAGGWMDTDAVIAFKGSNSSTTVYGKLGFMSSVPSGTFHYTGAQTKALYLMCNGYGSVTDNGGLAIDNDGVTVFGAGDAGSVFRVINEDNVNDGAQFSVTKASGAYVYKNLSIGQNSISSSYTLYVKGNAAVKTTLYTNNDGSSLAGGLSLYSNSDPMQYGIAFRGTGTYGKLGCVQSDWATYFNMNADNSRGWIFRKNASTGEETCVASISAGGAGYFSALGKDEYVIYPSGGIYTTTTDTITGAIAIALPTACFKSSTMLKMTVEIYNYSGGTSSTYVISGYNYSGGTWINCSAYSLRQSTSGMGNLKVRFGNNGARNIIWIGETNTNWSYPQVHIKDVTLGYSSKEYNKWATGWNISFATSFNTVDTSISNPSINYYSQNAGYATSAGNSDKLDGYHADDILPYGLENLCTGVVNTGVHTTLDPCTNGIITDGTNADTYFYVGLTEPLEADQIYTMGIYVTGVPSGNTATWSWPVGSQANSNWVVNITKNGWNWGTGYPYAQNGNNLTMILDDGTRGFYNSITMSKFVIVKGHQRPYHSWPTLPIKDISVSGGGSGWNKSLSITLKGTTYTITTPSQPTDSDSNVLQSQTGTSNYRPLVLGYNSNGTYNSTGLYTEVTSKVYIQNTISARPDAGILYVAKNITIGAKNPNDASNYNLYTVSNVYVGGYLNNILFKYSVIDSSVFNTNFNADVFGVADNNNGKFAVIRGGSTAHDVFSSAYFSGIAWKGNDTFGAMTVRYSSPLIKFVGGNGKGAHTWWIGIDGSNGTTYHLNNFASTTKNFTIGGTAYAVYTTSSSAVNLDNTYLRLIGGTITNGANWAAITFNRTNVGTGTAGGIDGNGLYFEETPTGGTSSYMYLKGGTGLTIYQGGLFVGTNNTYDIGSSSKKWANVYATTFHGSLDGNATSATNATNAYNLTTKSLPSSQNDNATSGKYWLIFTYVANSSYDGVKGNLSIYDAESTGLGGILHIGFRNNNSAYQKEGGIVTWLANYRSVATNAVLTYEVNGTTSVTYRLYLKVYSSWKSPGVSFINKTCKEENLTWNLTKVSSLVGTQLSDSGNIATLSTSGNADTATTATNLANNPSLQTYSSDTKKITVTAGGKTSSAYTVPYATLSGQTNEIYIDKSSTSGLIPTNFTAGYRKMLAVKQMPATTDASTIYFVIG